MNTLCNIFYLKVTLQLLFCVSGVVYFDDLEGKCRYGYSQEKSTLKGNSSACVKYEYGHLGRWYIKSTPYKGFLN